MNYCPCQSSYIDLEEYGCRYGGEVIQTIGTKKRPKKLDWNFFDELVLGLEEQGYVVLIKMDKIYIEMHSVLMLRELEDMIIKEYLDELNNEIPKGLNTLHT
jgi:hypothetical protein